MRTLTLLILLAVPMTSSSVFGLGYDLPPGDLPRPVDWPTEFYNAVNRPNRVHGYTFNQFDAFFYRGKPADLNTTIKTLAKTPDLDLRVVLSTAPGEAKSPWSQKPVSPADWSIHVENPNQNLRAVITIWVGGQIPLADLKIPAAVKLTNGGEIDAFIRTHNALSTAK